MGEDEEAPKLFTNKPRKEQLKQLRVQQKSKVLSSPSSSSSAMDTHSSAPPPKEPFVRRYKFLWPMLLAVNLGVGAYLLLSPKKMTDSSVEEEEEDTISMPTDNTAARIAETPVSSLLTNHVIKHKPIAEDQQCDLFKWILEEKRKIKPKDAEDKQQIDEEKAILKKYIRAKSIPSI